MEVLDIIHPIVIDGEVLGAFKVSCDMVANVNAEGDFSSEVPEDMLIREDEFGKIARADVTMKESIRETLRKVKN